MTDARKEREFSTKTPAFRSGRSAINHQASANSVIGQALSDRRAVGAAVVSLGVSEERGDQLVGGEIQAGGVTTGPASDRAQGSKFASPVRITSRSVAMRSRPTIHRRLLRIGLPASKD